MDRHAGSLTPTRRLRNARLSDGRRLAGTSMRGGGSLRQRNQRRRFMGKGILLWLIGIPLPIIILLLLFWH
ncbi:hypothetical protein E5A73_02440 [Sphingomonas gei]|uniref:Uncharacterized protein n=1 Tax=Sphingomonas gei TaxID=1395960 RepID=A0A4S1XIF6_9SPHN|nr:hypothetical protein E5A73_02440 [Sphingomonas gei]